MVSFLDAEPFAPAAEGLASRIRIARGGPVVVVAAGAGAVGGTTEWLFTRMTTMTKGKERSILRQPLMQRVRFSEEIMNTSIDVIATSIISASEEVTNED